MDNTWIHIIKTIHPDYDQLQEMADIGPKTKFSLTKKKTKWELRIEEIWPELSDGSVTIDINTQTIDDHIEWASLELLKWSCRRTAWDIWEFDNKKDAEKFILIFNLTWVQ